MSNLRVMITDIMIRNNLKLRVAIAIILFGLVAALSFHSYMRFVSHRCYPWNTFHLAPVSYFSDFLDVLRSASTWNPYSSWSIYCPFTYVVFHPTASMPENGWLFFVLFVSTMCGFVWIWICHQLQFLSHKKAVAIAFIMVMSYPMLVCVERGNIEIILLVLIICFIHFFRSRQYLFSLIFLVPAICLKLYPVLLLALFFRRGRFYYAVAAALAALFLTFGSLALFDHTLLVDWKLWQEQLALFQQNWIVANGGMSGSASLWNLVKLALYAKIHYFTTPAFLAPPLATVVQTWVAYWYKIYSISIVAMSLCVAWYVAVVEREFWRKIAVLIIYMVISQPVGPDYKLIHVLLALVPLIVISTHRKTDLLVVALLAAVFAPKRYWFFPSIFTDTGMADAPVAILINPLLLLLAFILLCTDGWRHSTPRSRKLRWMNMWTVLAWWSPVRQRTSTKPLSS